MIEIKVTGFKQLTVEFQTQNQALLFLTELKEEHSKLIRPDKLLLQRPPRYPLKEKNSDRLTLESQKYRFELRDITKKLALKVEIKEYHGVEDLL